MIVMILHPFVLALAIFASTAVWSGESRCETLNVVVLAYDQGRNFLSRTTETVQTVHATLSAELADTVLGDGAGRASVAVDVFDDVDKTMDFYDDRGQWRDDRSVIMLARAIRSPRIDAIVVHAARARMNLDRITGIPALQLSITYRILDVASGRQLGGGVTPLEPAPLVTGCGRPRQMNPTCLHGEIARFAGQLAPAVAHHIRSDLERQFAR